MPKTKLAKAFESPDYTGFQKTVKKRMIDMDTWYQKLSGDRRVTSSSQSIRNWVNKPDQFRLGDLIEFLKALDYSQSEIIDIVVGLTTVMTN